MAIFVVLIKYCARTGGPCLMLGGVRGGAKVLLKYKECYIKAEFELLFRFVCEQLSDNQSRCVTVS